jgi:hypothetical protein
VYSEPLDLSGIEQHAAADADGPKLSGALQPKKCGLANFQKGESLGARKQTRAGGFAFEGAHVRQPSS